MSSLLCFYSGIYSVILICRVWVVKTDPILHLNLIVIVSNPFIIDPRKNQFGSRVANLTIIILLSVSHFSSCCDIVKFQSQCVVTTSLRGPAVEVINVQIYLFYWSIRREGLRWQLLRGWRGSSVPVFSPSLLLFNEEEWRITAGFPIWPCAVWLWVVFAIAWAEFHREAWIERALFENPERQHQKHACFFFSFISMWWGNSHHCFQYEFLL